MTFILAAAEAPASPSPIASIAAVTIACLGAAATTAIGIMNYNSQKRSLKLQETTRKEELSLLRSAQETDRFQRAIEQLGNQSPHIRMGGIFALERMARDLRRNDRNHIIDTLAAFIRLSLPASEVGRGGYVRDLRVRAPDVQAALTVLCYPPLSNERVKSKETGLLNLARTDLRRASLRDARLDGVDLWGARLEGADLRGAHLERSIVEKANFGRFDKTSPLYRHGANLSGANLTGARGIDDAFGLDIALTEGAIGLA
jgi:hypothetical protein